MPFPKSVQSHYRTAAARRTDWLGLAVAAVVVLGIGWMFATNHLGVPMLLMILVGIPTAIQMLDRLRWVTSEARVDPEGVWVQPVLGRPRRLPWFSLRHAELAPRGVVRLETVGGEAVLCRGIERPEQFAERVNAELEERSQPQEPLVQVSREDLAAWLGIGLDEELAVYPGWRRGCRLLVGGLGWLAVTVAAGLLCLGIPMPRLWAAPWQIVQYFWVLPAPLHVLFRIDSDLLQRVWASADGLRFDGLNRRGTVRWEQVIGCERAPRQNRGLRYYLTAADLEADQEVVVTCLRRDAALPTEVTFRFHPRDVGADRLEAALQQYLAARHAGQALPRMTEVPEGALSRAEPLATAIERGISQV